MGSEWFRLLADMAAVLKVHFFSISTLTWYVCLNLFTFAMICYGVSFPDHITVPQKKTKWLRAQLPVVDAAWKSAIH